MDAIVQRTRLAMNLQLLSALFMLWTLQHEEIDVIGVGMSATDECTFFSSRLELPAQFKTFIRYELADGTAYDKRGLIGSTRVDHILGIQGSITSNFTEEFNEISDDAGRESLYESLSHLRSAIQRIENAHSRTGLPPHVTLAQLDEALKTSVRLPVINESVSVSSAVFVFGTALLALSAYLLSCSQAIRVAAATKKDEKGNDWLFFHPGWLGPTLGVIWLAAPPLALLVMAIVHSATSWYLYLSVSATVAIVLLVFRNAITARKCIVGELKAREETDTG